MNKRRALNGLRYFAVPALATFAMPLAAYLQSPDVLLVILAGGAIDQAVNSIGMVDATDLRKWCDDLGTNPWYWRAVGWGAVMMCGSLSAYFRFIA